MRLFVLILDNSNGKQEEQETDKRKKDKNYRSQAVIPYVEGISERVDRVLKKYGVATAMRPHTTLRRMLVYPNDKIEPEEQGDQVYETRVRVVAPT